MNMYVVVRNGLGSVTQDELGETAIVGDCDPVVNQCNPAGV